MIAVSTFEQLGPDLFPSFRPKETFASAEGKSSFLSTFYFGKLAIFSFLMNQINKPQALDNFITSYFELTKTNARIKQLYGNAVLDVVSDELLFKPRETLQTICSFLSVSCEEHYLSRVERVLYKKPSHTRNTVIWTKEQKDIVQVEMQKYSFLRQFTFD